MPSRPGLGKSRCLGAGCSTCRCARESGPSRHPVPPEQGSWNIRMPILKAASIAREARIAPQPCTMLRRRANQRVRQARRWTGHLLVKSIPMSRRQFGALTGEGEEGEDGGPIAWPWEPADAGPLPSIATGSPHATCAICGRWNALRAASIRSPEGRPTGQDATAFAIPQALRVRLGADIYPP